MMTFSLPSSSSLAWRRWLVGSIVGVVTLTLLTLGDSRWESRASAPVARRRLGGRRGRRGQPRPALKAYLDPRTVAPRDLGGGAAVGTDWANPPARPPPPAVPGAEDPAWCPVRDLPPAQKAFFPPVLAAKHYAGGGGLSHSGRRQFQNAMNGAARAEKCIRYRCAAHTEPHCQDHFAETDYAGNHPPCCPHVLRDLLRVMDSALCGLGLEYFLSYGGLLGVVRDDHVIPWTADNDYVVSFAVAEEIWNQRELLRENYGLNFFNDFFFRACASKEFMGGALQKWETPVETKGKYDDYLPYSDIFLGDVDPVSGDFFDERGCGYAASTYRPATRLMVYNQTFGVNVPRDYLQHLEFSYGTGWKSPPKNPTHHGVEYCPHSGFMRKGNVQNDVKWEQFWNARLSQSPS